MFSQELAEEPIPAGEESVLQTVLPGSQVDRLHEPADLLGLSGLTVVPSTILFPAATVPPIAMVRAIEVLRRTRAEGRGRSGGEQLQQRQVHGLDHLVDRFLQQMHKFPICLLLLEESTKTTRTVRMRMIVAVEEEKVVILWWCRGQGDRGHQLVQGDA